MLVLTIRSDKQVAEIGLYDNEQELAYETWQAHRQLAETIHKKINNLLKQHNKKWSDIQGVVVYKGPGSFTGLRIGLSVANALAVSLNIPISGYTGEGWRAAGTKSLQAGQNDQLVIPEYGAEVHTTTPRK